MNNGAGDIVRVVVKNIDVHQQEDHSPQEVSRRHGTGGICSVQGKTERLPEASICRGAQIIRKGDIVGKRGCV